MATVSLRKYGYKAFASPDARMAALLLTCAIRGETAVMDRLQLLYNKSNNPVFLDDLDAFQNFQNTVSFSAPLSQVVKHSLKCKLTTFYNVLSDVRWGTYNYKPLFEVLKELKNLVDHDQQSDIMFEVRVIVYKFYDFWDGVISRVKSCCDCAEFMQMTADVLKKLA